MADYPISNVDRRVQYVNSGVGPYLFAFEVLVQTDIAVYRGSTLLTLTSDYTVTINANGTGSVTLTTGGTGIITIVGARAIERTTDFTTGGDLFANVLNQGLDSQTIFSQQLAESLDRTVRVPEYTASTVGLEVNPVGDKLLGWDSAGQNLINIDPTDLVNFTFNSATSFADVFVGDGVETQYTLSNNPGTLFNLDISIDGVTQEPSRDYTLSLDVVTFTSPVPDNSRILVKYTQALLNVSGDSQNIRYLPAGTGAEATTVQAKLRETVSVKDFGAVGDGVTDDTNAVLNAIAYIKSRTNTAGYYGGSIYFPTGIYVITETIELATTSDVSLRFCFYGDGGYTGDGATQIVFSPSSAKNGLVLKSSQMCSFEDIEFISGNNNVDKLIYITSEISPVFSSFMNAFRRCSFREFSGTTPVTRLITIAGGVLTEFDKCWFSGTDNVIRLGESLPATESGGGAGQTIFRQCEIYQNIEVQNSQNLTFETCVFGRSNLTTPVSIYPVVSGFIRNDFVTFNSCSQVLNIANNTVTFFTQGAASEGLVAINNRFSSYKTAFNINGNGQVFFTGNFYQPPSGTTGCIAIILAANVKNATIGAEDFTLFQSGGFVAVNDNRLGVRKPLIVDSTLGTDYTFASIGNFETIITTTAQIRGGLHRIRWALNIETVDAAAFIVRPTVNGSVVNKASALKTIPASTTDLMFVECLVNIEATTAPVTIALTCRQGAGAAATVKADSVSYASFIQIEELQ